MPPTSSAQIGGRATCWHDLLGHCFPRNRKSNQVKTHNVKKGRNLDFKRGIFGERKGLRSVGATGP
jgi:hypothetical protein